MRKWDQHGAQMGAEIDEKSEKGEKKGMQKMMLEFDGKNIRPGGRGGKIPSKNGDFK